jgi:hypothetical protein
MEIKLDAEKFIASIAAAPASVFKEIRKELKIQLQLIQDVAKAQHNYHSRTGALQRDMAITVDSTGLNGTLRLDTTLPYAASIHDGSKPHRILPKGKFLRFVPKGGNAFVFSKGVNHPGTKPDPFLYNAATKQEPDFVAGMEAALRVGLKNAGL